MTYDPNADPVMHAGLVLIGQSLRDEIGPDVAFAAFIDWRDGRAPSYIGNTARQSVAAALQEWLDSTAKSPGCSDLPASASVLDITASTPLQRKCASLVRQMDEEDVGAALFLFGGEPGADGSAGETAWCASMPNVRAVVEWFVASERRRS